MYRDGRKAVESGLRACELSEWKDASHLATLAAAHAESSDFDRAVEFQEKANKLYADALYSAHYVPGPGRSYQLTMTARF